VDRWQKSYDDERGGWKNVLIHKSGSPERGQGWQKVADTLNSIKGFHVSGRAVRDKIMYL